MTVRLSGLRWYVAGLLCLASGLNYLDRQTLSVLAQTIQDDLHFSTVDYAYITSAFLFSYTVMYAVSGRLTDALGTRRSLLYFVSGWSAVSALHALARSALQFSFLRSLLGATEAANFPAGIKAVAEWFPVRERALAVGIFNAGTAVGAALAAPVVSGIALLWGWRAAFAAGGVLGALWVVVWALCYRSPREHPWLGERERELIAEGGRPAGPPRRFAARRLLRSRSVWACVLARVLTDPISYFFIFWTPKFLQQERGFSLAALAEYSWIPFVAAAAGNLAGGAIPRRLLRQGWTLDRARKAVMLAASLAMPAACWGIIRVPGPASAVALISVATFANGAWANMTLPAELFPAEVIGSVTGLAGACGGIAGILSQLAIGWTVQHVAYAPVFAACSGLHLAALVAVCLLAGTLGEIRDPVPA
jgi:MFS transporter, ACS family, aldohexuronate transporter